MTRKALLGLCVLMAAIAANYAPLLNIHAEQDDCVFGPVSNDDYRAYLARAKSHLTYAKPSFYLDSRAAALTLDDLFEKLSRSETSIYSRLAIMHAILRSMGAEYRNTNGNDIDQGRSDPFLKATIQAPTISFNYVLDINRLWIFSPWPREAWVIGSLAGPRYERRLGPLYPEKIGGLAFIIHAPNLQDAPLGFAVRRDGSCPPIPGAGLADKFSRRFE